MKKLFIILTLILSSLSCHKKDKLSVTCTGDCNNANYEIAGENSTNVTLTNYITNYTYDMLGSVTKITFSGTITYNTSGNKYQVSGIVTRSPCGFTVTVTNASGEKATCTH